MAPVKSLIAIDGLDGSGKSTVARRLATALGDQGCRAVIVSIDDFRRPVAWNSLTEPEVDVYYDRYYDLAMAEASLRSFLAGERGVTIPNYDSPREQIVGERELVFDGAEVAIVEGVLPLRVRAVHDGLIVLLEVAQDEARRRIITRDMKKGRSREETERRIDRRYFPAQARYRAAFAPRDRADVVIGNDDPTRPRVSKRELARAIERLRPLLDGALPR
jgi:uridine kinase